MSNPKPLVSIIIPTYNQEKYIEQAVRSCLDQNYQNLEVIVSDDCSVDSTTQILLNLQRENSVRLKVYFQENNLGRVKNYHKLLYEYAKGEWVINLDGDDFYNDHNFISTAIDIIHRQEGHQSIMFLMAGKTVYDELNNTKKVRTLIDSGYRRLNGKSYYTHHYFKLQNFSHSATLFRKAEALKLNFYSYDSLNTDVHSILKLSLLGDVILLSGAPLNWRFNGKGESAGIKKIVNTPEYKAMIDLFEFSKNHLNDEQQKKWINTYQKYVYKRNINYSIKYQSNIQVLETIFGEGFPKMYSFNALGKLLKRYFSQVVK